MFACDDQKKEWPPPLERLVASSKRTRPKKTTATMGKNRGRRKEEDQTGQAVSKSVHRISKPKSKPSIVMTTLLFQIFLLTSLVVVVVLVQETKPMIHFEQQSNPQPAVHLAKFGLIRGLKFSSNPANDPNSSNRTSSPSFVAAFLGIPYAAPPIHSLRFMPPGALRSIQAQPQPQNDNSNCSWLLTGSNNSDRGGRQSALLARPFNRFGSECVRLSNFLIKQAKVRTMKHGDKSNDGDDQSKREQRPISRVNEMNLKQQSEDCLNLNVFVPFEWAANNDGEDHHHGEEQTTQSSRTTAKTEIKSSADSVDQSSNRSSSNKSDLRINSIEQAACLLIPLIERRQRQQNHATTAAVRTQEKSPVLVVFHSSNPVNEDDDELTNSLNGEQQQHEESSRAENGSTSGARSFLDYSLGINQKSANSLDYIRLARRTRAIVVTFNYRIGLLGFLPYIDADNSYLSSSKLSPTGGGPTMRQNHAIWDQLSVLHWLKQNIAQFSGDPNNINLLAADNKATESIQVLSMSPLAKGLFKRVILLHEQKQQRGGGGTTSEKAGHLSELIRTGLKSSELRRKLVGALLESVADETKYSKIAALIATSSSIEQKQQQLFEFIQTANLSQLAQIEFDLRHSRHSIGYHEESDKQQLLFRFATEPNLNDRLLFPQFAELFNNRPSWSSSASEKRQFKQESNMIQEAIFSSPTNTNRTKLFSEKLYYCTYMRHLFGGLNSIQLEQQTPSNATNELNAKLNQLDGLNLIPKSSLFIRSTARSKAMKTTSKSGGDQPNFAENDFVWKKTATSHSSSNADESSSSKSPLDQLALIGQDFKQLHLVQWLNSLLTKKLDADKSKLMRLNGEDDDEDEEDFAAKQQERSILTSQLARYKRSGQSSSIGQSVDSSSQLIDSIGSIDLMLGFIGEPLVRVSNGNLGSEELISETTYPNVLKTLDRLVDMQTLDGQLAFWLKFVDFQFASSVLARDYSLKHYCDFRDFWKPQQQQLSDEQQHQQSLLQNRFRNQFVFILNRNESDKHQQQQGPEESAHYRLLIEQLANFIRIGNPNNANKLSSDQWPAYDSLSRQMNFVGSLAMADGQQNPAANSTEETVDQRQLVKLVADYRLNIVPKLNELDQQRLVRQGNSDSGELLLCLDEIELSLKQQQQQNSSSTPGNSSITFSDNNTDHRFRLASECLTNLTNKFRHKLRSSASIDLNKLLELISSLLHKKRSSSDVSSSNKTQITQLDIRSPNLLLNNDSNQFYDNDQSNEDNAQLNDQSTDQRAVFDLAQNVQAQSSGNSSMMILSYNQAGGADNHFQSAFKANSTPPTNNNNLTLRNLFAKAYKNSVGQALSVVVGTGSLIILVNVLIVLIVLLTRNRRRRQQQHLQVEGNVGQNERKGCQDLPNGVDASHQLSCQQIENDLKLLHANGPNNSGINRYDNKQNSIKLTSSFRRHEAKNGQLNNGSSTTWENDANLGAQQRQQRPSRTIKFDLSGLNIEDDDDLDKEEAVSDQIETTKFINTETEQAFDQQFQPINGGLQSAGGDGGDLLLDVNPFLNQTSLFYDAADHFKLGNSNNQHQCSTKKRQQLQQHEHEQITQAGSLTSPFASTSTTTTSCSNNSHNRRVINGGQQQYDPNQMGRIIEKSSQLQQQPLYAHSGEQFYSLRFPATQQQQQPNLAHYHHHNHHHHHLAHHQPPLLNGCSPSSSTTLSSTPIQLDQQLIVKRANGSDNKSAEQQNVVYLLDNHQQSQPDFDNPQFESIGHLIYPQETSELLYSEEASQRQLVCRDDRSSQALFATTTNPRDQGEYLMLTNGDGNLLTTRQQEEQTIFYLQTNNLNQ